MKTSELLAAKSSFEDNTKWLPFNVHANDTARIIKRLFNKWIAQNVRRRLCAAIGIESSENAEEIVCCLPRKTQKVGNHGISRNKAG